MLSITNQCSGHTSQEFWTAQVSFICPRTGFSPWLGIYNIYIYICILSILSLYVINMSTQIQLWVEEFVSNRFKPHSAVVPGRFWYIFLTAQFAEQVQEMRISSQEDQHTHTQIYKWEPLKPSFLGLSAHISRAEKRSFFMGFGVQRHYTERPRVFVGCFTLQATKSKIPAKTRIIKQFQIVELVCYVCSIKHILSRRTPSTGYFHQNLNLVEAARTCYAFE